MFYSRVGFSGMADLMGAIFDSNKFKMAFKMAAAQDGGGCHLG